MAAEIIVVRKDGGWRDRTKGYDVVVDGVVRGEVRAGQTLTVPVAAGHHTIRLEVGWTSSVTLTAAVVNKPVIFGCAPGRAATVVGAEEHSDSYVDIWQAASVEEVQDGAPVPLISARDRASGRDRASKRDRISKRDRASAPDRTSSRGWGGGLPVSLPVSILVWLLGVVVFGVGLLAGSGAWQSVVKTVGLGAFVIASWTVIVSREWRKRRKP